MDITKVALKLLERGRAEDEFYDRLIDAGLEWDCYGYGTPSIEDITLDLLGLPEERWGAGELSEYGFCRDAYSRREWESMIEQYPPAASYPNTDEGYIAFIIEEGKRLRK